MKKLIIFCLMIFLTIGMGNAHAETSNYTLGPGDLLRISVYSNPDLSLETRVSEAGMISFPLIGEVKVAGISPFEAEKKIAGLLQKGGYIQEPQVNILVSQFQSKMVSILGSVYKPGRYPLERATSLSDVLALAGGVIPDGSEIVTVTTGSVKKVYDMRDIVSNKDAVKNVNLTGGEIVYISARDVSVIGQVNRPGKYSLTSGVRTVADFYTMAGGANVNGSDTLVVTTVRDGKTNRFEVDVESLFRSGDDAQNIELADGDSIYVPRAPMVYIYGEVQRPGVYKLERNMTVMQLLAQGGGPTPRGTERGVKLHRRGNNGEISKLMPSLTDKVQADDVVYVEESLF